MTTGQRDVARDLLSTLAEWHSTIRMWSGSAFVAGEDIGDDAGARKQLYLDLCRIGNETAWMEDEITRLRASQAGGVPAGWKLVPVEPTDDMIIRGGAYVLDVGGIDPMHCEDRGPPWGIKGRETGSRELYVAMLSASPPPPATDGDALREALEPFALWATLMDKDAPDDAHLPATVPHLSLTLGQARAAADALGLVHASDDPRFNGERDIVRDALASSPPLAATDAVEAEREGCKCTAQDVHDYGPCDENCGYLLHHWRPRPWRAFHGLIERHRWGIECGDDTIVPPSLSEKTAKRVVNEFNAAIRARGTDEVGNG